LALMLRVLTVAVAARLGITIWRVTGGMGRWVTQAAMPRLQKMQKQFMRRQWASLSSHQRMLLWAHLQRI
jgi:hypothetical protein